MKQLDLGQWESQVSLPETIRVGQGKSLADAWAGLPGQRKHHKSRLSVKIQRHVFETRIVENDPDS